MTAHASETTTVSAVPSVSEPPPATDLPERADWLTARYLKNARDDDFQDYLREILQVGADGELLPVAVRDPLDGNPGHYIRITVAPEATIKSLASDILHETGMRASPRVPRRMRLGRSCATD